MAHVKYPLEGKRLFRKVPACTLRVAFFRRTLNHVLHLQECVQILFFSLNQESDN